MFLKLVEMAISCFPKYFYTEPFYLFGRCFGHFHKFYSSRCRCRLTLSGFMGEDGEIFFLSCVPKMLMYFFFFNE